MPTRYQIEKRAIELDTGAWVTHIAYSTDSPSKAMKSYDQRRRAARKKAKSQLEAEKKGKA